MATSLQPAARGVLLSGAECLEMPAGTEPSPTETPPAAQLSPGQQLLWSFEQIFPGTSANNLLLRVTLSGTLDTDRLERSINEVVSWTESLRLRLFSDEGVPACAVVPSAIIGLRLIDLACLPEEDQVAAVAKICKAEAGTPFGGSTIPRATLLCLSKDEHLLMLCVSEIGVSRGALPQLFRDLWKVYSGTFEGKAVPVTSSGRSGDPGYWKKLFSDAPAINLPVDWIRGPMMTCHSGRECFVLDERLAQRLAEIGSQANTNLATTLLAGLTTLLHRYTSQEDIIVGSTSWQRTDSLAPAAPVLSRTQLSAADPFADVLVKVRDNVAAAERHSSAGLEDVLCEWRDTSRHPVFQVGFEMLDAFSCCELPGLRVNAEEVDTAATRLDLTFLFRADDGGIRGQIEYNTDLFEPSSVRRMAAQLLVLLTAASENPEEPIGRLAILPSMEKQQVIEQWNATDVAYEDECVHRLFEKQVQRTPDAVALIFRDQHFTYRELNERAERLANHLRARSVGPDALVGVCVERSTAMLLSQLAIFKAGGAYVPLDPAYPRERLAFMAADAQLALLITEKHLAGGFDLAEDKILCVDQFPWDAASVQAANKSTVGPENLAYVIYTSGSTGKPKGVMLTHRNVANFFVGMDAVIGREPGVWLAVTSICFDISVLELFWTLSRGFKVVLQPDKQAIESMDEAIPAQIMRHHVTHFQCTPSLATILLQEPDGLRALRTVRKVLLGGEPLPSWLADKLTDAVELINVYGPTETTVWSSACQVRAGEPITIGRPIANTQIYVLDTALQPTPIGVPGEIYIGGTGTARGYLNRPELTAERFIRNPFVHDPNARIYRTGDLGRFLPDGRIECLGRVRISK